jgi:hypothetical protein
MANGFMPYLLDTAEQVFKGSTPANKITPPGFIKYLLDNGYPNVLTNGVDDGLGHVRDVKVKMQPRGLAGSSSTTDDCYINAMPVYTEDTVSLSYFRKVGMFIPDETLAAYGPEATATVSVGKPLVGIPKEIWETVMRMSNALFADMNNDLLVKLATKYGVNATTGLATAKTVNFPLAATNNDLTAGMSGIAADILVNEMDAQNVAIIGSGLITNYYMQQIAKSAAQNGLNSAQEFMPRFYNDIRATTALGANKFVIVDKNAVQLLKYNRFRGFKGGDHLTTFTGTIMLPVIDSMGDNQISMWEFDYQLKYNDCPQTLTTAVYGYGGSTHTIGRGWIFTLMSTYDIYTQAAGNYAAGDRLYGNTGILPYTATNV